MSRKLPYARIALIAAATLAAGAQPALADAEIPLGDAISGQYHVPEVDAVAALGGSAAAEPEQYQPEIPTGNSEAVSEIADAVAAPEVVAPEPPAPEPEPPAPKPEQPAPAPEAPEADPPAPPEPAPEPPAAAEPTPPQPDLPVEVPTIEPPLDVPAEPPLPQLPLGTDDTLPIEAPVLGAPAPAPAPAAAASNVNVSVRIFSPGDNGPVTQVAGGAGGAPPETTFAGPGPTNWTWNWRWSGAPGCDPGAGANAAPGVGVPGWTWNWEWTCDGELALPGIGVESGALVDSFTLAPLPALPELGIPVLDELKLPGLAHDKSAPRDRGGAGRERAPAAGSPHRPTHTAPAPSALASAPAALLSTSQPVAKRAAARNRGRDISRPPGAISAPQAPFGAPIAAAAGAAAAAGTGGGPAALVTLICLLACFLAAVLSEVVGLPRLPLRAARLERPG